MLLRSKQFKLGEYQIVTSRRFPPLAAMVGSVGYSEVGVPYDWHGLERGGPAFSLLQWTVSGRGRLEFEGREQDIGAGQAMLVQIPHQHRYYVPRDSDHWRFFYLCIHGSEVARLVGQLIRLVGPVWNLPMESSAVQTLMRIYQTAEQGKLDNPFIGSALAYEVVMNLGAEKYFPMPSIGDRFTATRAYAEKHYAKELKIDDLAAVAGMSRFHFTRQFTQEVGESPGSYLLQVRVQNAARLLGDARLSIKEVAARTGFSNANYLNKVFRRVLGISPREFRSSGMYSTRLRG